MQAKWLLFMLIRRKHDCTLERCAILELFLIFPYFFGVFFDGLKLAMKLAKGYRSENNRLLKNNSIPYEEFKICGIHTANQIINAVGHQKMHEDEINTFCCMVNQSQMLCGQILQECFNIGLQEKSEHISCFQCNSSPPFKLDSKRLTSPGIAHILAQP